MLPSEVHCLFCERKPQLAPSAIAPPDPLALSKGAKIFQCVPSVTALSRKNAVIHVGKSNEQRDGEFHACLYSLRDHPHGSDRSRRLLGAPRKGRCPRALEARLNGAEIASNYFFSACLSLRQSQPRSSFLSRGFLRVRARPVARSVARAARRSAAPSAPAPIERACPLWVMSGHSWGDFSCPHLGDFQTSILIDQNDSGSARLQSVCNAVARMGFC